MKKMIIAGGTGFLGTVLKNYFQPDWEVVILTRGQTGFRNGVLHVHWNAKETGEWVKHLEGASVIINLNGKSVDCRYTENNKQLIYATRLNSTRVIGEAVRSLDNPPELWINAASATIYRHAEDREMDEYTGEFGEGFSVDVCQKWEKAFKMARVPGTRKVAIRTGIVLGRNGGPFIPLRNMARFGLGGKQGNGRQYVSWLHEVDFARIIDFLIRNERCRGAWNVTAPNPLPNQQFMKAMRAAVGMPFGLPAPSWLLEMGARLIGTETELILKSRRVVPARLREEGFVFRFAYVSEALHDLVDSAVKKDSTSLVPSTRSFLEI